MTQENKELLLKDLLARLYYGFIIYRVSDNANIKINNIDDFAHFLEYSDGEEFKPYLRQMSSMTKEEWEEYKKWAWDDFCLDTIDWLNAHHFDYRHLIEKGIALEAPEGMYRTE